MQKAKKGAVLLITAFEPFDGAKTNASQILLERLKKKDWGGDVVFFGPVPVSFEDAWPLIKQEMEKYPDLSGVIALGQAEGRGCISLERFALNWNDGHTPDNCGFRPKPGPVEKGGPKFLRSNFPWQDLEKSAAWEQSTYAGTYVCNNVMYHLAAWARDEEKTAGFIHIPLLKSQVSDPVLGKNAARMDDDLAVKSFTRIIEFSLQVLAPKPVAPKPAPGYIRKFPPPRLQKKPPCV